ncbi:MAG: hypothetical protein M5U09_02770 [Gammaproteobacteria bacterium]|nr:hypothetical protein [Gammaproteobacteria bacterium]
MMVADGGTPILATFLDGDKKVLLADVAIDGRTIGHRYGDDIEEVVYTTLTVGGVSPGSTPPETEARTRSPSACARVR